VTSSAECPAARVVAAKIRSFIGQGHNGCVVVAPLPSCSTPSS
jgi:hypothetical protein